MAQYGPVAQSDRDSLDISTEIPLPNSEVTARLLTDEESCNNAKADDKTETKYPIASITTHVLIISFVVFACSVVVYGIRQYTAATDEACDRKLWPFSPMQEAVEYEWQQYDSDMIPSGYYGEPTWDIRTKWALLFGEGTIGFPSEKLSVINKSEAIDWRHLPPPNDNQIIAIPESSHQTHCVSFIYLFQYRQHWDFETAWNMTEKTFATHANHCFLILMTMIQCQADVTPVLFRKDHSEMGAWKPESAPHHCKKFDKLLEWQANHSICGIDCTLEEVPINSR